MTYILAAILFLSLVVLFGLRFRHLYRKERRERRLLNAIIQSTREGILLLDQQVRIVIANPSAESMFGYGAGGLSGKRISSVLHSRNHTDHQNLITRYIDHPSTSPTTGRLEGRKLNNDSFLFDVNLSHFVDAEETIVIAVITDVTERMQADELRTNDLEIVNKHLSRSQSLYRAMAHNFPDGIIGVMGRDMKWLLVDGEGLADLGLETNTLNGNRVFDDIHKTVTEYAEGGLKKVYDGEPMSFDISIQGKFYNVSSVPIYSKLEINEILIVIKNISAQKKMEQELIRTMEKEKELNVLKSRFVTMASHEFRTPLTTILSSSFLLENFSAERLVLEKSKHLSRIKHAVHSLTELLNDFLSLGKLEEGKVQVLLKPMKLRDFAEEILHEVSLSKKEDQRIVFEFSGNDEEILMDKHLLRNILLNVLSNAVKYSPASGTIGLIISLEPRLLRVKVTDQGIGIPQEEQKHIFKRFFRANNTSDIQGTGLGLNIVRRYVRLLQGRIEFHSKLNKGTVFIITLPLAGEK